MTRLISSSRKQSREERIGLRVDAETKALLGAAAEFERKSLSAFLLDAACARAEEVVQSDRIVLSAQELTRVLAELDRPAESVPELVHLIQSVAKEDAARDH